MFIDDFIDGLMMVIRAGKHLGTYHIGTQDEITIADLARMIGELFGKRVEIVPGPEAAGGLLSPLPGHCENRGAGIRAEISCARAWRSRRTGTATIARPCGESRS